MDLRKRRRIRSIVIIVIIAIMAFVANILNSNTITLIINNETSKNIDYLKLKVTFIYGFIKYMLNRLKV